MSGFKLSNLVVLHIYNYIKPRGQHDLLRSVEAKCKAIKLSTCMRHVYVLDAELLASDEQRVAYEHFIAFINKKDEYSSATTFERFDGQQAYEFLLSWMIAGKNAKKLFDDSRILGDVRAVWAKMQQSTSPNKQALVAYYQGFFNHLFTDAVQLRKLIGVLNKNELAEKLNKACAQCAWTRCNGFYSVLNGSDYPLFVEDAFLEHLKLRLEHAQAQLLSKVSLSPTGSEVVLFKSNYPVSEENLAGISRRLNSITQLLDQVNGLLPEKLEEENSRA